jgi:uncharacterized protein (TIGR01777 family)
MKIILPGGSGFLGTSLANYLIARGHEAVVLTRRGAGVRDGIKYVEWDGRTLGPWAQELDGADGVVNMTGKSVNCIYNDRNRREIIESRVDSVRAVHQAIKQCAQPPSVLIQAASLAIYGDTQADSDESAPHGKGFSVEVCERWEKEFFDETYPGTRMCCFRMGFALGDSGGALGSLVKLTRWYLGGTVGGGDQYISWLHIDDLNAMFMRAIENPQIVGVYNATSPNPVTNRDFMRALRRSLGKPWAPPTPSPLVAIGARLFLKTDASLALTGRKCIPARMLQAGFRFDHPDLGEALDSILHAEHFVHAGRVA